MGAGGDQASFLNPDPSPPESLRSPQGMLCGFGGKKILTEFLNRVS
jgi:hypothetical protein